MKVYQGLLDFEPLSNAVVTIGTFDGVHIGHRKIIQQLTTIAEKENGSPVVLTFFPHPRMVLQPEDNDLKLITTLHERIDLLKSLGVQHLIIQPFDKDFSRLSAVEFVRDYLVGKIGTKTLVIGYDHHFGRNREGSYRDLEEMAPAYNFRLVEIPQQLVNDTAVSSTKIRSALLAGDIKSASKLLGYPYFFSGKVIDGNKVGRSIGYPTANISVAENYKLLPGNGIYAVQVEWNGQRFNGMLYIGFRSLVRDSVLSIEVNIFNFNKDIYNENLTVFIMEKIRNDRKINSIGELKKLLDQDREAATKILQKRSQ